MSARRLVRLGGRAIVVTIVLVFATLVAIQYARVLRRNVILARSLATIDRDIAALKLAREERLAKIRRLEDPRGAIPEIHDRLRLLGPDEALIYIRGRKPASKAAP
ncbi:MAG: hypothetical protein JO359_07050 [Candidatus Eremiobacteraeota bacterium]|nr:hypothetical protein [Candidatus Eremiobacteraeota bacterium]